MPAARGVAYSRGFAPLIVKQLDYAPTSGLALPRKLHPIFKPKSRLEAALGGGIADIKRSVARHAARPTTVACPSVQEAETKGQ